MLAAVRGFIIKNLNAIFLVSEKKMQVCVVRCFSSSFQNANGAAKKNYESLYELPLFIAWQPKPPNAKIRFEIGANLDKI